MRNVALLHRRALSLGVAGAVVAGLTTVIVAVGGDVARADTVSPVVPRPTGTVTADALPTAQINGVVWSQAILGDTVYAGGEFTSARPAGAASGTDETPRGNFLSYSLSTGVLTSSFAPSLNAQVKSVATSPDGTRVYVAGAFTSADGVGRYRIAAYDTATGKLVPTFKPILSTQAYAVVATNTTVYVGGIFTTANGVARNRVAAFNASDGSLTAWDPNADAAVNTMVLSPDGTKLILGGVFQNVGGTAQYGMAAVDAVTGAVLPWAANQTVRDAGAKSAITSLRTDGTSIYGTGYVFGAGGNLEGTFKADPDTGAVAWVASCHGDTYDNYPAKSAGIVYAVSHEHDCSDLGGFRQTDQPWATYRTTAFTMATTGTLQHDYFGGNYKDWYGTPSPSLVNWYPDLTLGLYTEQGQAAWTVTGNDQYIVEGGEFPYVNGKPQQGLVRFAVPSLTPNQAGPVLAGAKWTPTATSLDSSSVHLAFPANYDRDEPTLRYRVYRGNNTAAPTATTPVYTTQADSQAWNRPSLGFTDTGLTPGATYTYQVYAVDPRNFATKSAAVTVTVPATTPVATEYGSRVLAEAPTTYWPANEAAGTTLADNSGNYVDATATGGVTRGVAGPVTGTTATTFDGASGSQAVMQANSISGPNTFTLEAWFKTTSTKPGEIVGFGSGAPGTYSQTNDRMLYLDASGRLYFGVQQDGNRRVVQASSFFGTPTYNNGQWYHVVATLSSSGASLYVNGALRGQDTGLTRGQFLYPGYWRVGGDNLKYWSNIPSGTKDPAQHPFAGSVAQVAIYPTALSQAQISAHYGAATSTNVPPQARFTSSCTDLNCSFDAGASTDPDGSVSSYAWDFGDGSSATGATATHSYAGTGDYKVTLTVTDNRGAPNVARKTVSVLAPNVPPTASFTVASNYLSASFDASGSSDSDGTIASYAWNYGDGTSGTGVQPTHAYTAAGTYTVTLTVTDNRGGTATTSQQVTATEPPNGLPTASFTATTTNLSTAFDASASSDPDGTIASYAWNFGDNTTGSGVKPTHVYTAGTYTVTLTVTDNRGGTATASQQVTATEPPNTPPTASFTATTTNLSTAFDASASSDPDGTIASYAWDFGDNTTGTGVKPTHAYTAAGTYTVTLTVTDNRGSTAVTSKQVTATLPPNTPPTASFTSSANGYVASADASASTDPDGTIASYAWDFGDGGSGSGVRVTHTYATTGTYQVKLTVTDDRGGSATKTASVEVTGAPTRYATDTFGRTVASGWGSADKGGAWSLNGGTTNYAVGSNVGTMKQTAAGSTLAAYLGSLSLTDTDSTVNVSLDKAATGGGNYVYLVGRHAGTSDYRLRVKVLSTGAVQASLTKVVNGTETVLSTANVNGVTYTAGLVLKLRLQVTGSATTTLRAKVWGGATEPAAWTTTSTDSTSPLTSGAPGVAAYQSTSATNSPTTISWSGLSVNATP